jgi:hypothetical protein
VFYQFFECRTRVQRKLVEKFAFFEEKQHPVVRPETVIASSDISTNDFA